MNIRLILQMAGRVLLLLAALMLPTAAVALIEHDGGHTVMLISAGITGAVGAVMAFVNRPKNDNFRPREGFAAVAFIWLLVSFFGCLPFVLGKYIPTMTDAMFESVSGFTTTGATILRNIEALPRSILFWRNFIIWAGGMGVLVLSLAILPKMSSRSLNLMRAESTGISAEKLVPRIADHARILYMLYVAMSVAMTIALLICGLDLYDALTHMFSAAGTGGFSPYNNGIAHFDSVSVEIVIGLFLILFGVNFSLYFLLIRKSFRTVLRNEELRLYGSMILGSIIILTATLWLSGTYSFGTSLRESFFHTSSVITSTGFSTVDYDKWPLLCKTIIFILMLTGCCAGSTGGGIKVVRVLILFKTMLRDIRRTVHPRSVTNIHIDGRAVDDATVTGVLSFFFAYAMLAITSMLILSIDGKTFEVSMTSVVTCLSNIGPGFGEVGPAGNFAGYSVLSKWVLIFDMLIGRLEIFPVLMLFAPSAWRK